MFLARRTNRMSRKRAFPEGNRSRHHRILLGQFMRDHRNRINRLAHAARFCGPAFLLALAMIAPAAQGGITIDDFTEGPLAVTLDSKNDIILTTQSGLDPQHAIGGNRLVYVQLNFPAMGMADVAVDTGGGTFSVDSTGPLEAYRLGWGLRLLSEGPASQALNADFSNIDFLRLTVLSASTTHTVFVQFRSGTNEATIATASINAVIAATATPTFVDIPLPNDPDIVWSDIDYLAFGEGPLASPFEVTFGGIVAVPEPGTLAIAGTAALALGGMMRRRRRGSRPVSAISPCRSVKISNSSGAIALRCGGHKPA
jgi:hypothetical protein